MQWRSRDPNPTKIWLWVFYVWDPKKISLKINFNHTRSGIVSLYNVVNRKVVGALLQTRLVEPTVLPQTPS